MPKVTQQHMDARREEIMAAARRCFVKDGFHSTSMQDIFAASGLSAGAVYRHFAKKEDIILAIAEANMADVVDVVRSAAARNTRRPVGEVIGEAIDTLSSRSRQDQGFAGLAVLVWSEALRNHQLGAKFAELVELLHQDLTEIIDTHQGGESPATGITAEAAARTLVCVLSGFLLQTALLDPGAVAGVSDTVRRLWPAPATG